MSYRQFSEVITFTRGSQATIIGANGYITFAPNNLLAVSNDLSIWTKTDLDEAANTAFSPNEAYDATIVTATANGAKAELTVSVAGGSHVIYSLYSKSRDSDALEFAIARGSNGQILATNSVSLSSVWTRPYIKTQVPFNESSVKLIIGSNNSIQEGERFGFFGNQFEVVTFETEPSTFKETNGSVYYGPRLNYHPITNQAVGFLNEPSKSNLIRNTSNAAASTWTKVACNASPSIILGPDNVSNAYLVVGDGSQNSVIYANNIAVTSNSHTYSEFFKYHDTDWIVMSIFDSSNTAIRSDAWFNIKSGYAGTHTGSLIEAEYANTHLYKDGWVRCYMRANTAPYANVTVSVATAIKDANTTKDPSTGFLVFGAQLEPGTLTSYIPRGTATATRSAEVAIVPNTVFTTVYEANSNIILEVDPPEDIQSTGTITEWKSESTSNTLLYAINSSSISFTAKTNGTTVASLNHSTDSDQYFRVVTSLEDNNMASSMSGTLMYDESGLVPNNITNLSVGGTAANSINGHVRKIFFYKGAIETYEELRLRSKLPTSYYSIAGERLSLSEDHIIAEPDLYFTIDERELVLAGFRIAL